MTDQTNMSDNTGHTPNFVEPAGNVTPLRTRHRRAVRIGVTVVAGLALAGGAAYKATSQGQPAELTALIPAGSQFVVTAQPDYFWTLTSSIRSMPQVQTQMAQAEKEMGFSYESDIRPWAGRVAVYGTGLDTARPSGALLLQVRDAGAFGQFAQKMMAKAQNQSKQPWINREYDGVTYQVIPNDAQPKTKMPKPDAPVTFANLNGWVALGLDEPSMKQLLDTYTAKAKSLQGSPKWASVLEHTPQEGVVSGAFDFGAMMKIANAKATTAGAKAPVVMPGAAYSDMLIGFTFDDKDSVLSTKMIGVPQTETMRNLYQKYAAKAYPIAGASLKKAPDTAAVMIVSNPAFMIRQELAIFSSMATTTKDRAEFAKQVKKAGPYLDISDHFTGEAAFGLTFNQDKGFGLVALAQADTPAASLRAARVLAKTVSAGGMPVTKEGTTWSMPALAAMSPIPSIPLTPIVAAQDRWLEISTHPFWITPAGRTPQLSLPDEAGKATYVSVGNLKWVPAVLDLVEKSIPPKETNAQQGLAIARGLHLETATWSAWSSIDPSGQYAVSTSELRGWDLKGAIDNTVAGVSKMLEAKPATGKDMTMTPGQAAPVKG